MLLGAAKLIQDRKETLKGTVKLVFQPGEEGHNGAYHVLQDGVLNDVEAMFGLHVIHTVSTGALASRPGPILAGTGLFTAIIIGKGGHGSSPHMANDPVLPASMAVVSLQQIVSRETDPLEASNRFTEFIRHTLAPHDDLRLKSFELHMLPLDGCDAEIHNEWVTFVVQHGVENIHLGGKIGNEGELLDSLFTCNYIMRMKLSLGNTCRKWPMAGAVKNLNKLVLLDMALPENLNAFISSSCPNLETLSIKFCDLRSLTDFSISNVSLKSLTIRLCEGIKHCEVTLITPSLETLKYTSDDVALDYSIADSSSLSEAKFKFVAAYWAHSRCIYHPSIRN